jgi:isopenicillin N synthase-like dioxygenase
VEIFQEIKNDLPKVLPRNFPEWETRMDGWGNHMIHAIETAAEMAAIGMGVEKSTFTERMNLGSHLLSPTGSDLQRYDVGTAFAGFHYDLNFITAHGKSRYPGLFIWRRD